MGLPTEGAAPVASSRAVSRRLRAASLPAVLLVALLAPLFADAAPPSALAFDGAASHVRVAHNASLQIPVDFTAEAWIRPSSVPSHRHVMGKSNAWELSVDPAGSRFVLSFELVVANVGWRHVSSGPLAMNHWYFVAGSYDGVVLRLFVGGDLVDQTPVTGNVTANTNPFRIGTANASGDGFNGLVDEVRLSAIARHVDSFQVPTGPLPSDAGTRGLWHLDEGSGTTVADASGNRNDGTFVDGPAWTTSSPVSSGDTTPPAISAVSADNPGSSTATVGWATDEPATSQVEYGLTPTYGSRTPANPSLETAHSVTMTGLTPNTTYHYRALSRDTYGNLAASAGGTFTTGDPTAGQVTGGEWSPLMRFPLVGVHSVVLYTGEVLMWDAWEIPSHPKLWNPATGVFTGVPNPFGLFCAGHSVLPDGRVLVMGGHAGEEIGIRETNIFDPATRSWSRGPDMAFPRWYPSSTKLGDGRVVVLSGNVTSGAWADTPEVYDPVTNAWATLEPVSTTNLHEVEYPLSFLLPDGKVFSLASSTGEGSTLDMATRTWAPLATTTVKYGSAVMYRPGRIMTSGGGNTAGANSRASTAVIDTTAPSPAWRATAAMAQARYMHNLVVLPDGQVLAVGGSDTATQTAQAGTLVPELWDPMAETWSSLPSMAQPRMYHSTAVLLPDGRVLVAGGGRLPPAPDYPTAEIYSPPYLFKGPRPTITSAPAETAYGATIGVRTPQAADIASVSLINLPSNTHTLDMDQHFVPLTFTRSGDELSVQTPASADLAPPGYYMLSVVSSAGVPSVSRIVEVSAGGGDGDPPTVALTAPTAGATVSGSAVAVTATASDNVGVASVQFLVDGAPLGAADQTPPYSVAWDSTTVADGTHTLGAQARDASGNVGTATTVTVTVSNAPGDGSPPVISAVQATGVTATRATISWTTDEPSDSQVEYGPSTQYGQSTVVDTGLVESHGQDLIGLTPGTTYHYRVKSRDAAGNLAVSSDRTFTTAASSLFCAITTPSSGATVSGTVTVSATVSGDAGGTAVQFKVDGTNLGPEDTTAPFSAQWDTTTVANGAHTLTAVARDSTGAQTTSSPVAVTVANGGTPGGPVAAYSFDEGAGTTVTDRSGNGNTGVISNAAWTTGGRHGGALSFNGADSWVTVPTASSLGLTSAMTLEAWVRPARSLGNSWVTLVTKESATGSVYALYANSPSKRPAGYVHVGSDQDVRGATALPAETWTHLAVTYDGAQLRLYVDGSLVRTKATSGAISASGGPLRIGGTANGGRWFSGLVDDVRVYNRALTGNEIQADMAIGVPG